jgi:hypothetical protein
MKKHNRLPINVPQEILYKYLNKQMAIIPQIEHPKNTNGKYSQFMPL